MSFTLTHVGVDLKAVTSRYCHVVWVTGYKYAGMQYGIECWCGDTVRSTRRVSDGKCDMPCPGNSEQYCGGFLLVSVYHTGIGDEKLLHPFQCWFGNA